MTMSSAKKNAPSLVRKTFAVSRLADFASVSEIAKLVGAAEDKWPLVIVKELADNALDAAEEAGVAPVVEVEVSGTEIVVSDLAGHGLDAKIVAAIADYTTRTSSREAYVSPTRGQQGNAMQAILAMGFALDGEKGETLIESRSVMHRVAFSADPVRRTPEVKRERSRSAVQFGTRTTVRLPDRSCSIVAACEREIVPMLTAFAWLNPHLTLRAIWNGETLYEASALDPSWRKWRPSDPTSSHWYDVERLTRLMAAEIAHAEDRRERPPTVRDFLAQFRGLARTQVRSDICAALDASGMGLRGFFDGGRTRIAALLKAMRAASREVEPKALGVIGRDHLAARFAQAGCEVEAFFDYKREAVVVGGLPYLIEAAFAYEEERKTPGVVSGINFSPLIGAAMPFRDLAGMYASRRIERDSPVLAFLHLTSPRVEFSDTGKTTANLPSAVGDALEAAFKAVTEKWVKQMKVEDREAQAFLRREEALSRRARAERKTKKDAAFEVMERAYVKASANGTLHANPRQIMYAARPMMLALLPPGTTIDSVYFTQTLFPAFQREFPDLVASWKIDWDERGHFAEPHTELEFGVGTANVRWYRGRIAAPKIRSALLSGASVKTFGPAGRFGGVLYIEKEGFEALMQDAEIERKFDIAVLSNKGFSVTAGRELVDEVCGCLGLPLYILHDFDISGFGIAKTLVTTNDRYVFKHKLQRVIDLGLRIRDVGDLESEEVVIGQNYDAVAERLKVNGAIDDEITYLLDGQVVDDPDSDDGGKIISGHRVELNAMTSAQFVAFVERKLIGAGARKVVPGKALMGEAYAAFAREKAARPEIEALLARLGASPVAVPEDLDARVRAYLAENPAATWDKAVSQIAGIENEEEDED
jgi:DNA topoisomerase VI subunit B